MNAPFSVDYTSVSTKDEFVSPTPEDSAVLITGGAHRIGRAIAEYLAKTGWPVALHYNVSKEPAVALCDRIRDGGGIAEAIDADLSRSESAETLIARATERVGPIGLLINNASVYEWDDMASLDHQSWARHMDLNLRTPVLLCQQFVRLLPLPMGGVIINMLDSRVLNPTPRHMTYTLSKAGLWTFTRTLAQELAPRVRVNGIGPGPTLPPKGQSIEQFHERCARLPLRRPASLDEICQAVQFFVSAPSVTGQMLALDGGDHLVGYRQFA